MDKQIERESKNRKLAEWLGVHVEELRHGCYLLLYATGELVHSASACRSVDCAWSHCPDFYTDEAANALLLEKMSSYDDVGLTFDAMTKQWGCSPNENEIPHSWNLDRKTAICEAALSLIEASHEK